MSVICQCSVKICRNGSEICIFQSKKLEMSPFARGDATQPPSKNSKKNYQNVITIEVTRHVDLDHLYKKVNIAMNKVFRY